MAKKREKILWRYSETFPEWRFEPLPSKQQYVAVIAMSLAAVACGAGVYGMFLSEATEGPVVDYSPYAFMLGLAVLVAATVLTQADPATLRVGLFGIGSEQDGKIERTSWYQLDGVSLSHDMLRLTGVGRPLSVSLKAQAAAARRILAEAQKRIPERLELEDSELDRIGKPRSNDGEQVDAETPQVTGLHCLASEQELTFEKDVRLCGRCGAPYHRAHVPNRCVGCDRQLKRA